MLKVTLFIGALSGILLLSLMLLFGVNRHFFSQHAPTWLSRLIIAGLLLLATRGSAWAQEELADWKTLIKNSAWQKTAPGQRVDQALQQAQNLIHKGSFQFSSDQQTQSLQALENAVTALAQLVAQGVLDPAEAELGRWSILETKSTLGSIRPREMQEATCYEPMPAAGYLNHAQAVARLTDRLPYLEKMVASKSLNPNALAQILVGIKTELLELSQWDFSLDADATLREIRALYRKTDALADTLGKKLPVAAELTTHADWEKLVAFFKTISVLDPSSQTSEGLQTLAAQFQATTHLVIQLRDANQLDPYEAEFVIATVELLQDRFPDTKNHQLPSGESDQARLIKPIKLIIYLTETQNYHPEVLKLVLPYWKKPLAEINPAKKDQAEWNNTMDRMSFNPKMITVFQKKFKKLSQSLGL